MPPNFREHHGSWVKRRADGGEPHIGDDGRVVEALHQDGSVFLMHLSVNDIPDEGKGINFAGKMVSVTQEHLFNDERTANITIDPKGVILDCDRRCCEMFGFDESELIGENIKRERAPLDGSLHYVTRVSPCCSDPAGRSGGEA